MMAETLEVKSRPLLFSDEMVRAYLAGKKTQTRRIIQKVRGFGKVTEFQRSQTPGYDWTFRCRRRLWQDFRTADLIKRCPYGVAGEVIYGRESFWEGVQNRSYPSGDVESYFCGKRQRLEEREKPGPFTVPYVGNVPWMVKRPSIHMPKSYARVWAQIVDVRIEQLSDITEADAYAEGVTVAENHQGSPDFDFRNEARVAYRQLWERINGPGSWTINPFVWVIEFRKIAKPVI